MTRFKNISDADLHVGRADGPSVKAGEVTVVDDEVVEEIDDAYIVGEDGDARAWPKATWELLKDVSNNNSPNSSPPPPAAGKATPGKSEKAGD